MIKAFGNTPGAFFKCESFMKMKIEIAENSLFHA